MRTLLLRPLSFAAAVLLLVGCEDRTDRPVPATDDDIIVTDDPAAHTTTRYTSTRALFDAEPDVDAAAIIQPAAGAAEGYVAFTETDDGLRVQVRLRGLEPNARRGFHVHENGSCAAGEDGTPAGAAGGHFAPMGAPHGGLEDPAGQRHVGDFGNLESDADGNVDVTFHDNVARLTGERGVIGKAVIVHLEEDDLQTQPTGDAGGRSGCGIIEAR